jgi:phenylpyruvate tautomerase PptA (4-oxalocrotonate tautomerase family)
VPMIELFLPRDALPQPRLQQLQCDLTTILLKWEKAPDTAIARSTAWIYAFEVEAAHALVGGAVPDKPRYRVMVTVPKGTMDGDDHAGLIHEVTRAVLAAEGSDLTDDNGVRVWVILREVEDGLWGVAGRVFRLSDIARYVHKGVIPPLSAPAEPKPLPPRPPKK